jgi:RNA ligase (TIGR02306 family)
MDVTRKLASVRRISEVSDIEGADAIVCAKVDGWQVVVKKGEFKAGELAVFFELDSWVPSTLAPFLSKGKEPREFNGVKGERLRTVKLKGCLSQGLLLSFEQVGASTAWLEGEDLTTLLGIQKWEAPLPTQLQGVARGTLPSFLRRTDQERVQNLAGKIDWGQPYHITMKLDGSSMQIYRRNGEWGVCSRNIDLKMDQEGNTFVEVAKKLIDEVGHHADLFEGFSLQGELMGPGIQGNRENLTEFKFYVFDIWDIDLQRHTPPGKVWEFCKALGFNHVPVLSHSTDEISNVKQALAYAEGPSLNHKEREGAVFRQLNGLFSFKAISNKFLLKAD